MESESKFENTIGFYRWGLKSDDNSYIHPDDFDEFTRMSYSRIFEYAGNEGEYILLRHDRKCYRVKADFYYPIPALPFKYGDIVETATGTKRVGVIRDIIWHIEKKVPMYFIRESEKNISKRYWESDLRLVEKEEAD